MKQTFSEMLVEYLRLRDKEIADPDVRSPFTRARDSDRMNEIECEMDRRIDLPGISRITKAE